MKLVPDPNGSRLQRWRFRRLRSQMEYGAFVSQMRGFDVSVWEKVRDENIALDVLDDVPEQEQHDV